ncbi:unnamed protein product [Ectocarpus sp. CCAP 1310/34]|nr:unnamed protein product [Ectocarpus sp. CCAP 1310/34]
MAHFEDCKFYRQRACLNGVHCGFRHNEASRHTERLCNRWAAGYTCDGRCNLRHPSAAEIAALAAAPPPASAATAAAFVRPSPSSQQPPNSSRPSAAAAAAAAAEAEAAAAEAAAAAAAAVVRPAPSRQQPPKKSRPPAAAAAAAAAAVAAAEAAAAAAIKARAPPCRFYARGLCTKGRACPFFHAPSAQQVPAERTAPESSWGPAPTTLRGAAAAARKATAASEARAASGEERRKHKGGAAGKREPGVTERPRKMVLNSGGGGLGVSVEADAAAKRRAAEILQKHRLTSSTPAKEAGSRGGMHIRGAARTQPSDKKSCAETSGQRQPRPPTGRHSGHSSTALASPLEAAEASSKGRTIPADNNGKNTGAKTGKRVGEQEEAAGAEEAPACEGAVLLAPSPKKQATEEIPSTTARAATKAVGKLQNT